MSLSRDQPLALQFQGCQDSFHNVRTTEIWQKFACNLDDFIAPILPQSWSSTTATMATELTVQSERAFQKQPHIFLNHKAKAAKSKRVGKGGRRWFKDVGLGFRTPKNAIEGSYIGMSVLDSDT